MKKWIIHEEKPVEHHKFRNSRNVNLPSNNICIRTEKILSFWKKGSIPKVTPSQRVPFLSEKRQNDMIPLLNEIQVQLWTSVPEGSIFDAINEFMKLNPQRSLVNSRWDLEVLIKVLNLRPDYSFKLINDKENHRVFPPEIMIIFDQKNNEDLEFFRKIDFHTFSILVKTWLSKLVKWISGEEKEKILRIASMVTEDKISNIRIYLQQNSLSLPQALLALNILLEKNVDLSGFEELEDRLLSELRNNNKIFDEFYETGIFGDFQNWIINHPELQKLEIEKIIQELLKNAPGVKQKKVDCLDQEWIHQFDSFFQSEDFNPEKELSDIYKLPSWMRRRALNTWKELYGKQISSLSQVVSLAGKALNDEWIIGNWSTDEILHKILVWIEPFLVQLSIKQRRDVIVGIQKYIVKAKSVRNYANIYKNNPSELVAKCLDTDVNKLKWNITMEVNGASLTFHIYHIDDYSLLSVYWKEVEGSSMDYWVSLEYSKIEELRGTITLINWQKTEESISTQIHESAHADNNYLMPDINNKDNLSRAKNEIIAFLKEWEKMSEIASQLFRKDGAYDYYDEINRDDPERYLLTRKIYKEELSRIIRIADRFYRNRNIFPYYLDLLAITPVREWHRLEEFFL